MKRVYVIDVMSGKNRGPSAALTRVALLALELPFAAIVGVRNRLYDRGILTSTRLARPTISVGNLTAGGVGKTPLVAWLAAGLRAGGHKPAVLMRGYKSVGKVSDEQMLLSRSLGNATLTVIADPDRRRGARAALAQQPEIDVFLLDDAMQHRRVRRDFEIVLISAVQPWGYGHLLPRGLLREPFSGLKRADAVVITHANEVPAEQLREIETTVRRHNSSAPIFRADHRHIGLQWGDQSKSMDELARTPYFLACAIGQPEGLLEQLRKSAPRCVGHEFFSDHHFFIADDFRRLMSNAALADAEAVVVTEKDWVKLEPLVAAANLTIPIWRLRLEISFWNDDGQRLLSMVSQRAFGNPC